MFAVPFPRILPHLALPLALIAMGGNLSLEKIKKGYKAMALVCFRKVLPMVL